MNDRRIRTLIDGKGPKAGIKVTIGEPNFNELRNGEEIRALVGNELYSYTKVNNQVFKDKWTRVT